MHYFFFKCLKLSLHLLSCSIKIHMLECEREGGGGGGAIDLLENLLCNMQTADNMSLSLQIRDLSFGSENKLFL